MTLEAPSFPDPAAAPLPRWRIPSERFNVATHSVGALLAVAGLVYLVLRAETAAAAASFAIYGACLVALFSSSTLHHLVSGGEAGRQLMRRIDHVAIYLLIAGTYTPVCVLGVRPEWGIPLLVAVWGFGLVGIGLKVFRPFTSRWVTIGMYIGMGWAAVVATGEILRTFEPSGVALLAGGGIVYTAGAVVYALKRPDIFPRFIGFHGVWHVLVLVAAGLHYAFIALHVPTA